MEPVYMPIEKMKVNSSMIDLGFPTETDPISWLLTYVGYGNYHIENDMYKGWYVSFDDESHALAFKLRWCNDDE